MAATGRRATTSGVRASATKPKRRPIGTYRAKRTRFAGHFKFGVRSAESVSGQRTQAASSVSSEREERTILKAQSVAVRLHKLYPSGSTSATEHTQGLQQALPQPCGDPEQSSTTTTTTPGTSSTYNRTYRTSSTYNRSSGSSSSGTYSTPSSVSTKSGSTYQSAPSRSSGGSYSAPSRSSGSSGSYSAPASSGGSSGGGGSRSSSSSGRR